MRPGILLLMLFVAPLASAEATSSDWKRFRYDNYGFEFKLPADWQQIEEKNPNQPDSKTLVFSPKGAEYGSRPYNAELSIRITDNPKGLSYEKLSGIDVRPDLVQNYNSEKANYPVGGKPAKLMYDLPEHQIHPIAIVTLDQQYLSVMSPKEGEFAESKEFQKVLATFKFYKPIPGSTSHPEIVKQEKTDNAEGCAKAPQPGSCYEELARKSDRPLLSWCEAITLQNSGGWKGMYYSHKNLCYTYSAVKLKDVALCDKMEGQGQFAVNRTYDEKRCKDQVNTALNTERALQTKDLSYCDRINVENVSSYLDCYVDVAMESNNQKLCDKLVPRRSSSGGRATKAWCYYTYAVRKKDCSLVPADSPAPKSQCEYQIKYRLR